MILFTNDSCDPCHLAKSWLRAYGVEFEERSINDNPKHQAEVKAFLGRVLVPLLVTDEEEIVMVGYTEKAYCEYFNTPTQDEERKLEQSLEERNDGRDQMYPEDPV